MPVIKVKLGTSQEKKLSRAARFKRPDTIRVAEENVGHGVSIKIDDAQFARMKHAFEKGKPTSIIVNGSENEHLYLPRASATKTTTTRKHKTVKKSRDEDEEEEEDIDGDGFFRDAYNKGRRVARKINDSKNKIVTIGSRVGAAYYTGNIKDGYAAASDGVKLAREVVGAGKHHHHRIVKSGKGLKPVKGHGLKPVNGHGKKKTTHRIKI